MILQIKTINQLIVYVLVYGILNCNCHTSTASYSQSNEVQNIFGGYKITPKSCNNDGSSGICMFNSDCKRRHGQILGVCLDGFLFGVCCRLDDDLYSSTEIYNKRSTTKLLSVSTPKKPNNSLISNNKYVPVQTIKPPNNNQKVIEISTKVNDMKSKEPLIVHRNPILTNANDLESFTRIPTITAESPTSTHYVFSIKPTQKPSYYDVSTHDYKPTLKNPTSSSSSNYELIFSSTNKKPYYTNNYVYSSKPTNRPSTSITVHSENVIGPAYNVIDNFQKPTIILLSSTKPPKDGISTITGQTVFITPKPSSIYSAAPYTPTSTELSSYSADEFNNFPPVRNPNLNTSILTSNVISDDQIQEPNLIEDDKFNKRIQSFVKDVVQSLKEPFSDLRDVVLNKKNASTVLTSGTKRPTLEIITTKKPIRKPATTPEYVTINPPKRTKPTKKPIVFSTNYPKTTTSPSNNKLDYKNNCGIRPLMKRDSRIVGGKGSEFGEWPWIVLIRESTWLGLFTRNKCGGVLITKKFVLTAAHCQPGFLASLIAVFGEYDISGDLEPKKSITRNVIQVIVHRKYVATTFENDIALLKLEKEINYDEHIVPICLPDNNDDFTGGMATVVGWGRLRYQGGVPSILQEVQVPIMENNVCQELFITGGHQKKIHDSFMCAGYANGQRDSCEGDSGGPLMLQRSDGIWKLAGTVSHGIQCAAPYLPGIYMRTAYYKPWILSIVGENQSGISL